MLWFLVQRGSELLVAFFLWDEFGRCQGVVDVLEALHAMTHLAQIGAVAAVALMIGSIASTIKVTFDICMSKFKSRN
jgi:hypothetical protein